MHPRAFPLWRPGLPPNFGHSGAGLGEGERERLYLYGSRRLTRGFRGLGREGLKIWVLGLWGLGSKVWIIEVRQGRMDGWLAGWMDRWIDGWMESRLVQLREHRFVCRDCSLGAVSRV